jgi:heme oxygenase
MEHPFMKSIYAKTFDKHAYAQYLLGQYLIFTELEELCSSRSHELPLSAVYDELLHRSPGLLCDLCFWGGTDWESRLTPSKQTELYLERLRSDADNPWLLLCHHFLNYNAVLSGGQFLGRMVTARATEESDYSQGSGAEFYNFPAECEPTHMRVQQYIDAMDGLDISAVDRDAMLHCMRDVYALLLGMFDEAYAIAPVAGISYGDSQSAECAEATEHPKASGAPPPPLEPLHESFKLADIRQGSQSGQILTSVLGRVYDVTVGKEFFGKGGPYEIFAGHDGTYNLAAMTLKAKTLDKFTYEFDDEEKQTLADWIAYFDHRYGRPLGQIADAQHCITLSDLPLAEKIPFSGENSGSPPPQSKL